MRKKNSKLTLITTVVTIIFGAAYFYIMLPAINLSDPSFYGFLIAVSAVYCLLTIVGRELHIADSASEFWEGVKKSCLIPLVVLLGCTAIYLVGTVISTPFLRAKAYSRLLTVTTADFIADIEEISFTQIPMLDEDSAKKLGDAKMGELADMVSQFDVATDYVQINYRGRPVRVTPLCYDDYIKWFYNTREGLPAYLIIDMVSQNVDVVRISEIAPGETGIRYSTNEHFSRHLSRHLRFNYPTYMFDPANFEINDDGIPYWVCPRIVKRIGLFGGEDIDGAVLVNAITGESEYFASDQIPAWVDRVYTSDLIMKQYDYYGKYQSGFINSFMGQKNVTVTTEGYNYIAIGDDIYTYSGITSVGEDSSNIGFILTNQRFKTTKFYPIAGATELSASASAQGAVQHLSYTATFPLLLNISSQPTYFMALKDKAGLVKKYAMVNVSQYQIVATGDTVSECNLNYIDMLARNGLSVGPVKGSETITGVIEDIRAAVIDGNSRVYIKLRGNAFYYSISVADNELAIALNIGDRVSINIPDSGAMGSGSLIHPALSVELQ